MVHATNPRQSGAKDPLTVQQILPLSGTRCCESGLGVCEPGFGGCVHFGGCFSCRRRKKNSRKHNFLICLPNQVQKNHRHDFLIVLEPLGCYLFHLSIVNHYISHIENLMKEDHWKLDQEMYPRRGLNSFIIFLLCVLFDACYLCYFLQI
jgi:hypothetical protein